MTMKLAKSLEEFSRASLTSVIVRDCHSLPVLFSRVARKESVLLLLDSSMASEVKSFVKRSFKHLQGQKKPRVKPLLCEKERELKIRIAKASRARLVTEISHCVCSSVWSQERDFGNERALGS